MIADNRLKRVFPNIDVLETSNRSEPGNLAIERQHTPRYVLRNFVVCSICVRRVRPWWPRCRCRDDRVRRNKAADHNNEQRQHVKVSFHRYKEKQSNAGLQLRRAINIQAEGMKSLEKHAIAPSAARLCYVPLFISNRSIRFRHAAKADSLKKASDSAISLSFSTKASTFQFARSRSTGR